ESTQQRRPDLPGADHRRDRGRDGHAVLRSTGRGAHRAERRRHPGTHPMTASPALDSAILESRRRLALRAAVAALLVAVVGFPLGMAVGGSERGDTVGGALLFAAI